MDERAAPRKLASIVAVDVAGYSRRTETDEDAAVRAVAILREQIALSARVHGGRVFNTAGDGFMLEFPSAASALAAAEQIAIAADPPVRIGVHLGDVSVTPAGDLLALGVNVAARIQQMATPGAVLASGDVKRAIRGPLGERLKPQGSVKLDKMSENLPVFALAPAEGGRARGRRRDFKILLPAGFVLAVALAAGAAWLNRDAMTGAAPPATRLVVLPFQALSGDQAAHSFAEALADSLQSALSTSQMPVVSPEDSATLRGPRQAQRLKALGVRLLFDGTVTTDRDTLRARVHLDDPGKHVTLWSIDLSGPASNPDAVEAQVGARAVAVLNCAAQALRPARGLSDPEVLALYLHACDLVADRGWGDDAQAVYGVLDTLRQVAARAPGFAPGHSTLARLLAYYRYWLPAESQGEAEREARRALTLDPKDGDAYAALSDLRPRSDYAGREHLADQALAADPSGVSPNLTKAVLLSDVGRSGEGLIHLQRAAAASPAGLGAATDVDLVANGQTAAGNAELDRRRRLWPHSAQVWYERLQIYGMEGRSDDVLALLDDRQSRPKTFGDAEIQMIRTVALAGKSRTPAAIAQMRRALLAPVSVQKALEARISTLSSLGLVDDAFRMADGYAQAGMTGFSSPAFLFSPGAASMRRDPRFMTLAAKLGLVHYWRSTGKWPDFCAEPGLPYACKAEAAKAVGASRN